MIQGKDGALPQVFCSHDITLCKIDNFISFFIYFPSPLRTRVFRKIPLKERPLRTLLTVLIHCSSEVTLVHISFMRSLMR